MSIEIIHFSAILFIRQAKHTKGMQSVKQKLLNVNWKDFVYYAR